eukprot:6212932-Pleurochrysis_carterae.AAC.3
MSVYRTRRRETSWGYHVLGNVCGEVAPGLAFEPFTPVPTQAKTREMGNKEHAIQQYRTRVRRRARHRLAAISVLSSSQLPLDLPGLPSASISLHS